MAANKSRSRGSGRPFATGTSGNPAGSSAKARANKVLRRLTSEQVSDIGTLLLEGGIADLKTLANDPEASVLKTWMAALIAKSMRSGDAQAYRILMERICGRVKETVELTGKDGAALDMTMTHLTTEEKIARADALAAARLAAGDD